ncbi:MAG TPA: class I mannose-6-phosphate isomerase, partial [Saprospiraceae bacterium]|nr:class I mannose-6-phosphate isomerase [Saprospiraceae bacterium]
NYAWCFDCVPEENSIQFDYQGIVFESPAINLVFFQPKALLGERVYARFGAEFPIRFDFLDTMDGGNLSLQVHPTTEYIREHFGMFYTQDESYYMLDAGEDASVFLGVKAGINPKEMLYDLKAAQNGGSDFDASKYIARWPAKKHDHFLIPAGTVHCSGTNCMVLEISATPYIFTFKLWDWGRKGLDGLPRPIHIEHGEKVIQWDRTDEWVARELINKIQEVSDNGKIKEEVTGLHDFEFIETVRHWFTDKVIHHTHGSVHVLNLVEGEEVIVESPNGTFEPFAIHYAETFIVPAAVGSYSIRPLDKNVTKPLATIRASIKKQ